MVNNYYLRGETPGLAMLVVVVGITFVVAQKRHKTRLFPESPASGFGRMGNVPPGTVVDTEITHPTENSFFLASHEGIQVCVSLIILSLCLSSLFLSFSLSLSSSFSFSHFPQKRISQKEILSLE